MAISSKRNRGKEQREERLFIVAAVSLVLLLFLFASVVYQKVVNGAEYEKKVLSQKSNVTDSVIEPLRGSIYDAYGNVLVQSVEAYNVILDPYVIIRASEKTQLSTAKNLCAILGIEDTEKVSRYFADKYKSTRYIQLSGGKGIGTDIKDKIQEKIKGGDIVGVWFEETQKRVYTSGSLAAHVLGFVNVDGGVYGVEQYYNDILSGTNGRKMLVADENGNYTTQSVDAVDGNNLVLTINSTVQYYMESILANAVQEYNASTGCAICINPQTGEVYGWANVPTFNPASPNEVSDVSRKYASKYSEKSSGYYARIWNNIGLTYTYQPGSTYKPVALAIAIEEGAIDPYNTYFSCKKTGYPITKDINIYCYHKEEHGQVNVRGILQNSCNQGVLQAVSSIKAATFLKYQRAFGLGQATGIDLAGELTNYNGLVYTEKTMGIVEKATSSFGQGFNLTAIQMIMMEAACINGGYLLKPYVVSQITDSLGNVIQRNTRTVLRQVVSESTSDVLRKEMEASWTIRGAQYEIPGYHIGGKSGTAEQGTYGVDDEICSYISYTTIENPEVMLLVVLNGSDKQISQEAFLTNRAIMEKILPILGIYAQ